MRPGSAATASSPKQTGRRAKAEPARRTPRTLLFPASEVTWTDIWDVIGLKGTGSDRYSVTDLFVPEEFTLDRDDPGERRLDGAALSLPHRPDVFEWLCLRCAWHRPRHARGLYLAGEREDSPRLQNNDAHERRRPDRGGRTRGTASGNAFVRFHDDGSGVGCKPRRASFRSNTGWQFALLPPIAYAKRDSIASDAYNAAGSTSVFSDNPFERRLRDINSVSQQFQGRRSHFETVGKYLLGVETEAFSSFL